MNARPTANQIAWHDREIGMFFHFGLYTYRERDAWALPGDPKIFTPFDLDPHQWTDVALSLGARYIA
jgi:alpha-L-fucosidase